MPEDGYHLTTDLTDKAIRLIFEGGVADPLLISWPRQIKARGELRHRFARATDLVPTICDCLGLELPEVVKGFPQIAGGSQSPLDLRK